MVFGMFYVDIIDGRIKLPRELVDAWRYSQSSKKLVVWIKYPGSDSLCEIISEMAVSLSTYMVDNIPKEEKELLLKTYSCGRTEIDLNKALWCSTIIVDRRASKFVA